MAHEQWARHMSLSIMEVETEIIALSQDSQIVLQHPGSSMIPRKVSTCAGKEKIPLPGSHSAPDSGSFRKGGWEFLCGPD